MLGGAHCKAPSAKSGKIKKKMQKKRMSFYIPIEPEIVQEWWTQNYSQTTISNEKFEEQVFARGVDVLQKFIDCGAISPKLVIGRLCSSHYPAIDRNIVCCLLKPLTSYEINYHQFLVNAVYHSQSLALVDLLVAHGANIIGSDVLQYARGTEMVGALLRRGARVD